MIKKKGDLFTTDAHCIGHGVNCEGVMGAGIAKAFREKFPLNYTNYRSRCQTGALKPGQVFAFPFDPADKFIFNIASQEFPGKDARYSWLFDSCRAAAERALYFGYDRIAIPQIGCGIGGLHWDNVEHLLLSIEILYPGFQWEVWQL